LTSPAVKNVFEKKLCMKVRLGMKSIQIITLYTQFRQFTSEYNSDSDTAQFCRMYFVRLHYRFVNDENRMS